MVIQSKFSENESVDSAEEMFNRSIDVMLDRLNKIGPNALQDIYASRLAEAERGIDQQYESEKYDSLVQKWHVLRMIFSIYSPEL